MPLTTLLNRPITIVRRTDSGTLNDYGDETETETTQDVLGELQQVRSTEPGQAGELSVSDWVLYLPPLTDIRTGDAVLTDDGKYEVVGDPRNYRSLRMQAAHHVKVSVKRTVSAQDV